MTRPQNRWRQLAGAAAVAMAACVTAGCAATAAPAVATVPKLSASEGLGQAETRDPRLRAALARLTGEPSASAHREVAAAYRALGITDQAFTHLQRAVAREPHDAVSHDLMARQWRDWGRLREGLAAARTAVKHAPDSAAAHNTLGTLHAALGDLARARRAYWRAIELDRDATYALDNMAQLPVLPPSPARAGRTRDTETRTP